MNDIVEKVDLRFQLENRIAASEHIKRDDPTEKRAPEDYFTPQERESLVLTRPGSETGKRRSGLFLILSGSYFVPRHNPSAAF